MNIFWSEEARDDLLSIFMYIAQDDPQRAAEFTIELEDEAGKLADWPEMGVRYSELLDKSVRALHYKSYTILYEVAQDAIYIHEVFNQAKIHLRLLPHGR